MNSTFLKPRLLTALLAIVVLSFPLVKEKVLLPSGNYEVTVHRPVLLLASYIQTRDYYSFVLMVGSSLLVYSLTSLIVVGLTTFWTKTNRLVVYVPAPDL